MGKIKILSRSDEAFSDRAEAVVLRLPDFFAAVGQFYGKFNQTTDEEVIDILKEEFTTRGKRV